MRKVLEGWRQDGCDLIVHSIPDVSCYEPTESGGRSPSASVTQTAMLERLEHRPMLTATMVLLAVLVLLVVALAAMLEPAAPIGVGGRAVPPGIHPTSTGGPDVTEDPYIDRHAEVVATFHNAK